MNTNRWIWNNSNIHNNTSAGTVLYTIKGWGKGRQVCCRTTCHDSQTFVDLKRLPDWCSAYENSSIDDTTPPAIAVVPDSTSRRSPQLDHFTNVVVQLLRCRLSRPPRVSTDSHVCRNSRGAGTITFKLFDAPLHESYAANFNIEVSKVSRSPRWLQTLSQHQRF